MSDNRYSKPFAFKRTTLAAAIALTFATPGAFAATAPSANQLPGNGKATTGNPKSNIKSGTDTITLSGKTVIQWGGNSGTANINTKQPAGFNIGSNAAVTFTGGTNSVLNIDASGNPSQIMGTLKSTSGNLFVANGNGIIVGSGATITSAGKAVGLIGDKVGTNNFGTGGNADGITFNGTSGGYVKVAQGANVGNTGANGSSQASTVLIASGGNVNIHNLDSLQGSSNVVDAGDNNLSSGSLGAQTNTNAVLTVSGAAPANTTLKTANKLVTTGTAKSNNTNFASHNPTLDIGSSNHKGTLENEGTLYVQGGLNYASSKFSTLNNGVIDLATKSSIQLPGGLTNKGQINIDSSLGAVKLLGGGLTNKGTIDGSYLPSKTGNPLTRANGTSEAPLQIVVLNGSINNSGSIKGLKLMETLSNPSKLGFTSGANYSITNSGTISSGSGSYDLYFYANDVHHPGGSGNPTNNSTGSVTNTGVLKFDRYNNPSPGQQTLKAYAYNNVTMGGQVEKVASGATTPSAVSASNPLGFVDLEAGQNLTTGSINHLHKGTVTLSTPLTTVNNSSLWGQQVKVMSNLSNVTSASDSTPSGKITINAGDKPKSGYALRVAKGKTVSANKVDVYGRIGTEHPNVILQGTLSGNAIKLGGTSTNSSFDSTAVNKTKANPYGVPYSYVHGGPVSDVFSGPKGGLTVTGTSSPTVTINFTGRIKTAPYLNDSSNFRYNDLPITSKNLVNLNLNPFAYQSNGTTGVSSSGNPSAVNILVNNSVTVKDTVNNGTTPSSVPTANGSSVNGINNWPNTHLVLQSTGDIKAAKGVNAGFYWPGLVYMGTIKTVNGQPAPGTLSDFGTITANGNLNNVLPGSTAKGGGMHLMTAQPVAVTGKVVTNAKSWVNFPTTKLTNHYANNNASLMKFYGGSVTNSIVNYNLLPKGDFHTQAVVSKK